MEKKKKESGIDYEIIFSIIFSQTHFNSLHFNSSTK